MLRIYSYVVSYWTYFISVHVFPHVIVILDNFHHDIGNFAKEKHILKYVKGLYKIRKNLRAFGRITFM